MHKPDTAFGRLQGLRRSAPKSEPETVLTANEDFGVTMKRDGIARFTWPATLAALLSGCGSSGLPVNTAALSVLSAPLSTAARSGRRDLLYATSGDSQMVIYTYPQLKERFDLVPAIAPVSECSDRKGDVFVATGDGLLEYQHGAVSPIATIGVVSQGCSIDPVTGDLAVVQYDVGILLFRFTRVGWHLPALRVPPFAATSCTYDDQGNLFVDGAAQSNSVLELAELPKGSKTFTSFSVSQRVHVAGFVQWDGAHLAVTDSRAKPTVIYRYSISGGSATLVGKAKLQGSSEVGETWIYKGRVIAAVFSYPSGIGIWKYPGGGSAISTIPVEPAGGVTISI
jgi:hypothetical protein